MATLSLNRIKRIFQKPPHVLARRLLLEFNRSLDRLPIASRRTAITTRSLLRATGDRSIDQMWQRLSNLPYFAAIPRDRDVYQSVCPGDERRILGAAERAMAHYVDLLGSGEAHLGDRIDWHRDYRSGFAWPKIASANIEYCNPDQPSDVKFPWEVSRMQWLIPVGQAYCLTGEEYYAAFVRDTLQHWFDENPFNIGVNYTCTMEVALRIFTWTWFFHMFKDSPEWSSEPFRERLLCNLFSHGIFTERYLEYSDVNGNHCTADAAGMMFTGLFFGQGATAQRWQQQGWKLLEDEIVKQVFPDGVDFEASTAYHRLVLELFLFPVMYANARGVGVLPEYKQRLVAMAKFARAYSRPDGTIPLLGDADDGRALPMGGQAMNDHRYLSALVGATVGDVELLASDDGSNVEVWWLVGESAAVGRIANPSTKSADGLAIRPTDKSQAFPDGGNFIMRNERDHVFIDCGPVGQGGRGGHGHNDCLSFDAVLNGVLLITDCGCFTYTSSYQDRNEFRSTASHNTPQIDGQEMNRFVHPDNLWALHDDAQPVLRCWTTSDVKDTFQGSHSGYQRLMHPVTPVRTITLDHQRHALEVVDEFEGEGEHETRIPLHLAAGVEVEQIHKSEVRLTQSGKTFTLRWDAPADWTFSIEPARVSSTYGRSEQSKRLVWKRTGKLLSLRILIEPA